MAKRCIRQFDTSALNMNTKRIGSRAIGARGDMVFFQGQMGFDLDGKFVGHGDPGAQAEQACKNIKSLIEEAGRHDRRHLQAHDLRHRRLLQTGRLRRRR